MSFLCLLFCGLFISSPIFSADGVSANKDGENIILDNGNVRLVFSANSNYKLKAMDMGSQSLLPSDGVNTFPWQLTYKGPNGENPVLVPKNGTYEGVTVKEENDAVSLVFTWQMVLTSGPTYPVRMYVTLKKDSKLAEWNLEADVPAGWIVANTDFPRISVLRPEDAKAITSAGWGIELNMSASDKYSSRYPSCTGAMQLLLMHGKDGAFYYATEDKGASGKYLKMDGEGKLTTFHTETVTSEAWTPAQGGTFRLPWPTVVGFNPEGWQKAVTEWYRPFTYTTVWGSRPLASRNIPEWLYKADVWLRPMNVTPEVMESVRQAMKLFGKGVGVHWYYWHNHPFDTNYPDYFPAQPDFAKMVKETRKLGGYVTPYINGRLWDPATESYKTQRGKEASCRKADGTLYTEVYSSKVLNTVTCPASSIWQNVQKQLVERIQGELGTSGVYIDQIAAAASEPCWASNHGHALGGGDWWHYAYRNLLTDMRENHLKKDNILTSEENAECYIDLFDMLLTVNTPHNGCSIVPLFPLVYSDRVITSAFAYTPANLTTGTFRYENMQCLLWGSQLGWVDPQTLMKPESKKEADFLKDMMLFRRKQHDVLYGGRFMGEIIPKGDNPEWDIPGFGKSPVVRAAEWQSKDGKSVILVVNIDDNKHSVELPNGEKIEIKGLQCLRINQ